MRVCTFLPYPSTSIEVGTAGFAPSNIEKLPTSMSQAVILGTPFETQNYFTFRKKGGKDQELIQPRTTLGPGHPIKSDESTIKHHIQESQEVSPFPVGDHKTVINRRQDSMTNMKHKYQKRSTKEAPPWNGQ